MPTVRTRVKICGITRPADAQAAVAAGADALGLVFHPPSPRAIDPQQAAEIARGLPAFVTLVGLFVDAQPKNIERTLRQVPLQALQFHGSESPDFCARFPLPYLKALRLGTAPGALQGPALAAQIEAHSAANAILLDTHSPTAPGGTGETFDWDLVPRTPRPLILAGGLTATNVTQAIRRTAPYAVDVSGGVESTPGCKDPAKLNAFLQAVRRADER